MDFHKCLEILNSRPVAEIDGSLQSRGIYTSDISTDATMNIVRIEQNSLSLGWRSSDCIQVSEHEPIGIPLDELQTMESIALVHKFRLLQEMRIRIYHYFNNSLNDIIQHKIPDRYPSVCGNVTNRFSNISIQINKIRDVLKERQLTEFSDNITSIQGYEKDKLMYVAAQHLDQLQDAITELKNITGGKTEDQVVYLTSKIKETEALISESMEDIMCSLSDLAECV